MKEHLEILNRLHACDESKDWAVGFPNAEQCWNNCKRSDWMIWMIRKLNNIDINFYKKYACFCARQNWHLLTDQRSKDGIIAVEQYIAGKISIDEMKVARKNAADAADAADAAAAAAAAYAAANAAYAAYAAYADAAAAYANAATYAATYAAYAAYAAYADAAAAYANAATNAADAAAYAAAYAAYAAYADAAAAKKQIKIDQCNWIRSQFSFAKVMERLK